MTDHPGPYWVFFKVLEHLYPTRKGFFIEVGAFDGETKSCTAPLADDGWNGLMFEPGDVPYELCRERHKNNNVRVIKKAMSNSNKKITFYKGTDESGIDFTASEEAHGFYKFKNTGPVEGTYYKHSVTGPWMSLPSDRSMVQELDAVTLDHFLESNNFKGNVDVLRICVVGYNKEVLQGLTKWKPTIIITDHGPNPGLRMPIMQHFAELGYYLVAPINFFVPIEGTNDEMELDLVEASAQSTIKRFTSFLVDRPWVFVKNEADMADNKDLCRLSAERLFDSVIHECRTSPHVKEYEARLLAGDPKAIDVLNSASVYV